MKPESMGRCPDYPMVPAKKDKRACGVAVAVDSRIQTPIADQQSRNQGIPNASASTTKRYFRDGRVCVEDLLKPFRKPNVNITVDVELLPFDLKLGLRPD